MKFKMFYPVFVLQLEHYATKDKADSRLQETACSSLPEAEWS